VAGFLGDGQGVAVGPESDGVIRAKIEKGAQAAFDGGENRAAQAFQGVTEIGHGFGEPQFQFGDPVEVAAVLDNLHDGSASPLVKLFPIIDDFLVGVNFYLRFV
jgi:hypothetical protein